MQSMILHSILSIKLSWIYLIVDSVYLAKTRFDFIDFL